MSVREDREVTCGCSQRYNDILRAAPGKKSSLIKIVCENCGKVVLSNVEKKYCFDCKRKLDSTAR
jgi:uncharacterized OB-fold protein